MRVTPDGTTNAPLLALGYPTRVVRLLLYNTPLTDAYAGFAGSTVTLVREPRLFKRSGEMLVMLLGIVMLVRGQF